MEATENGHSGTGVSLPKKAFGLITQLKCICHSACSVGSKQEILEDMLQEENHGIVLSQRHRGMTGTTEMVQWLVVNSSEGAGKE